MRDLVPVGGDAPQRDQADVVTVLIASVDPQDADALRARCAEMMEDESASDERRTAAALVWLGLTHRRFGGDVHELQDLMRRAAEICA